MMDLKALLDKNAWLLMVPAVLALWWIDPAHAVTLLQWTLYAFVIMGVVIILSRITLPQIRLTRLMEAILPAHGATDPRAAAQVVLALLVFVGLLAIAVVIWAKP